MAVAASQIKKIHKKQFFMGRWLTHKLRKVS